MITGILPSSSECRPYGTCPPYFSQLSCGAGTPWAAHSRVRLSPCTTVTDSLELHVNRGASEVAPVSAAIKNTTQQLLGNDQLLNRIHISTATATHCSDTVNHYTESKSLHITTRHNAPRYPDLKLARSFQKCYIQLSAKLLAPFYR